MKNEKNGISLLMHYYMLMMFSTQKTKWLYVYLYLY